MNDSTKKLAHEGSSNFEKFSSVGIKSLLALNAVIVGVFAAIQLLSGVNLLQAAMSVDQSLAVVQSASQGTQEQLAALKGVVGDLTRTTIANFNDILQASAELARGGVDIQDQIGGALKSVIELSTAAAGELPFDKAARAIASASTIFKIAGEDTSRVANALTVAAQQSSASFNDIIRSFQQVAPIAPLLKISLEDVAAAVGVLGKAGLRGSDAGTSLKQMFIQLLTPTKKAAELMDKYKISLFDVDGAVRPLGDLLQDLGDKFGDTAVKEGKLTAAQRDSALATIFGADAIRAAALIAINGTDDFFKMRNAMLDGTYTAAQLAAIIQAPLGSQLKILQNNLQATAVDIGTGLLPVIRSLVVELIKAAQAAAPFAKAIGDALNFAFTGAGFADLQQKLSDLFGSQLAASILGFVTSIQAAIVEISSSVTRLITQVQGIAGSTQSVDTATQAFYDMANAVQTIATVVSTTILILGDLVQLANENKDAFENLKIVLVSIGVGLVAAAFVGLILLLGTIASAFSAILIPALAVGAVGAALVGIFLAINKSGQEAQQAVANLDQTLAEADLGVAVETATAEEDIAAFDEYVQKTTAAINNELIVDADVDVTTAEDNLQGFVADVIANMSAVAEATVVEPKLTVTEYKNGIAKLIQITQGAINTVIASYEFGFNLAVEGIKAGAINVLNQIIFVANEAAKIVSTAFGVFAAVQTEVINHIKTSAQSAVDSIGAIGNIQIPRADFSGLANDWEHISDTVAGATDRLNQLRIDLPNRFVPAVRGAREHIDRLDDSLKRTTGSMDGMGGGGAGKVKKGAKEAEEAIVGFTEALEKAIRLQSFIDAFGDVGAKAIDALVEAVTSNIDKDGAKAAEALQKFKQLLRTEMVSNFAELGAEADAVFAQALIERSPEAIDAAIEVIRRMAEAAKAQGALTLDTFQSAFNLGAIANQLGSAGSKLFKDLTKAIVEGGTEAVKAVGNAASDVVATFIKDLSPAQAREFTTRFMAEIAKVIKDQSPESVRNFQDFARQLNFDQQVVKAQNTLDKAIGAAVKTHEDALTDEARKTTQALNDLYDTKRHKDFAEAEKLSIKEIGDLQLEVLKNVQDHQRRARQEEKEDTRQKLEDDRAAADLKDKRDEELADAIKARRKRLNAALKGNAPTKEEQAQGRAIQGNQTDPTEDEVKALQKKWTKEDARAAIVLQRRKDDLVETRRLATEDELFELDLRTQFEEQKKIIEKPFKDAEKAEKEADFQKQVADIFKASTERLVELDKAKTKAIENAQTVYDDIIGKLELEKTLADTVFEGMLTDLEKVPEVIQGWDEILKNLGGEVKIDFTPRKATSSDEPGSVSVKAVPNQQGLSSVKRAEQTNVVNRSSTVTNNISYTVNPTYSQPQDVGDISLDLQAMVALTR